MEPISAIGMQAWRLFLETHRRVTALLEAEMTAESGLPLPWYDVLVQLSESTGQRMRMQELANAVLLSKSGLTRLVDRMEGAGLVTRDPCVEDRRGHFVVLTSAGYERLREAAPAHLEGVRRHFLDSLSDEQAHALRDALGAIARANQPSEG